jgi:polar amino acid transport system substrate-binding protein
MNIKNVCLAASALCAVGAQSQAKEVRMAFGLTLHPYVIADTSTGFELEIIKEALAVKGHTLKPMFMPMQRIPLALKDKQIDAAARGAPELVEGQGFFYSTEPAAVYQDYAISLKKNNLTINQMQDLKGKSILGFPNATVFLGDAYAAAVSGNSQYSETNYPKSQPLMLYANRVQVVVSDKNIFKYYSQTIKAEADIFQELDYHRIFSPVPAKYNNQVFIDAQIRDDFNAGLKHVKATGRAKEIMRRYVSDQD